MARILKIVCAISVMAYLCVSCFYFLGKPAGLGDEALFLSDVLLIQEQGWLVAIEKGISIPYMTLTYVFQFFLEDYIALRTVNVLLFGALLLYFYKRFHIKDMSFYSYLLFYYSTVGFFLLGTNDTIFTTALVIFIVETYRIIATAQKQSVAWLGASLVVALFTRELILVFIPVLVLALFFLLKFSKIDWRSILIPLVLLIIGLAVNIPSLQKQGTFSYDQKNPPLGVASSWEQRQYYAQLLVNEGSLKNNQHPSWEETDAYLQKNGSTSLPDTVLSGILFEPVLTIKEFFKEMVAIGMYGTRQLALILPSLFILGVLAIFRLKKIRSKHFIPLTFIGMCVVFATIIISFIELRWLAPIFVAGIFYFHRLQIQHRLSKLLVSANYVAIFALSCYGVYGLLLKL